MRPLLVATLISSAVLGFGAAGADGRPLLVTVDDLPIAGGMHADPAERERITRDLLAVLESHGIRAVGFVTWSNVRDASDRRLLELWLEAGHELGNHTDKHLDYRRTEPEAYIADAERARERIAELLAERGQQLRFFRFPMLREGDTEAKLEAMRAYLTQNDQQNLCPTIDTQDWGFERPWVEARRAGDETAMRNVGEEYQRSLRLSVESQEQLGDRLFGRPTAQTLLLHANEVGAAQWGELFEWLKRTGHRFATAYEVLADEALRTGHDYVGERGPGLWRRIEAERSAETARSQILEMLEAQTEAWNRGDIDEFVDAYADDVRFLTPSGIRQGREQVRARYLERYPDRAAMGALRFEILGLRLARGTEVTLLGDAIPSRVHGASLSARWTLEYPDQEPRSGLTLLVFRRGQGRWWIVEDASM